MTPQNQNPVNFANEEEVKQYLTETTKKLRVALYQLIDQTKKIQENVIRRDKGGREYSLAATKMQEARHWLGEALGQFGNELPEEYRDYPKKV